SSDTTGARIGIMEDVVTRFIMQNTPLSLLSTVGTFLAIALFPLSEASAEEAAETAAGAPAKAPNLGGHLALGAPTVTDGTPGTSVIGRDFGVAGIVAGINLGLTPKWSIDFEFIALGDFNPSGVAGSPSTTVFVLDPGVVYNAGFLFAGVRAAMRVPSPL